MLDITPDLCDEYPQQVKLLPQTWLHIGKTKLFYGPVETVRCFEDNSRVKELLATPGEGRVLLVDGEGSLNRALVGDLIAQSAMENGWAGVVVLGAIRDVGTIDQMEFGIKALGACPIKTERRGLGYAGCNLELAGVEVVSGDYLYADLNGVLVSKEALPLPI